jgi:hypothetical protein
MSAAEGGTVGSASKLRLRSRSQPNMASHWSWVFGVKT